MRLFKRLEKREAAPYTDAVVDSIVAAATGGTAAVTQVGALEIAAGYWARAMASAAVTPDMPAVTPALLGMIGRELCRRGEAVFLIAIENGGIKLYPAAAWDIRGGAAESSWLYRVDIFGPSGNRTVTMPAAGVVHVRYAVDPARPWAGISPVGWARATGKLAANLEQRLGEEAGAPVGNLLAIPKDGGDSALESLRKQLANLRGKTALVETTTAGWGDGRAAAPMSDWSQKRIGGNPPEVLNELRSAAAVSVMAACGVPPALGMIGTGTDGTAQREGWRRFLHGTIAPVAAAVAGELAMKLDAPVQLNFDSLFASDLTGRARAFSGMVKGGMAVADAAALAGLVTDDEG